MRYEGIQFWASTCGSSNRGGLTGDVVRELLLERAQVCSRTHWDTLHWRRYARRSTKWLVLQFCPSIHKPTFFGETVCLVFIGTLRYRRYWTKKIIKTTWNIKAHDYWWRRREKPQFCYTWCIYKSCIFFRPPKIFHYVTMLAATHR